MNINNFQIKHSLILIVLFSFFCAESIHAQKSNPNRKQQLESERIAFITKQLNLSVQEAQQFWPVYNEYQQKKNLIQKRRKAFHQQTVKQEILSNKELEELSDEYIALQVEESTLSSQYHQKFKTVLPIQKVVLFYEAEEKFKMYLLRQVQKNKETKYN